MQRVLKNKQPPTSSEESDAAPPLFRRLLKEAQREADSDGMCEKMRIPVCISDDEPPLGTKSLIWYPRFHICFGGD